MALRCHPKTDDQEHDEQDAGPSHGRIFVTHRECVNLRVPNG